MRVIGGGERVGKLAGDARDYRGSTVYVDLRFWI